MENDLIEAVGSWLDNPKNASFSREVRFDILCKIYSKKYILKSLPLLGTKKIFIFE